MDPAFLVSARKNVANDAARVQEQAARQAYALNVVDSIASGRGRPKAEPVKLANGAIIDPSEGVEDDDIALAVAARVREQATTDDPNRIAYDTANALRSAALTNPEWRQSFAAVKDISPLDFADGNVPPQMAEAMDLWGRLASTPQYRSSHADADSRELIELGTFARSQGIPDRQIAVAWQKAMTGNLPAPLKPTEVDRLVKKLGSSNEYEARQWIAQTARLAQLLGSANPDQTETYIRERMATAFSRSRPGFRGVKRATYTEGLTEFQIEALPDFRSNIAKRYHEQISEQGASPDKTYLYRIPGGSTALELRDSETNLPIEGVPLFGPGDIEGVITEQQAEAIRKQIELTIARSRAGAFGIGFSGAAIESIREAEDLVEQYRRRPPVERTTNEFERRGL
jgi:hypothetical protein